MSNLMRKWKDNMKNEILLIEDDQMIATGIKYALEGEGYEVRHCASVTSAYDLIASNGFDLAILDMQLPDGDGFDISPRLEEKDIPVIFLTVVDDESKIVKAFDEGAADYIVKPFRVRELLARVKRTINQQGDRSRHEIITISQVKIDTTSAKVWANEELIELTALEYRLLLVLARNRSCILSRGQILEQLWDYNENYVEDNTLTVYVKRLRQKLGDAIAIETIRGMGYRVD